MKVTGERAALLAGARTAAELASWEYKSDNDSNGRFELTAKPVKRDSFWLSYRPLYVEVELGTRRIKWAVLSIRESRTKMTITVEGTWGDSLSRQKV